MENQLTPQDKLKVNNDSQLSKILEKGEQVFWSQEMCKINIRRRQQIRRFVLTDRRLLNVGDEDFGDKFISFFKGSQLKREISLKEITAITVSEYSNQFILHIPTKYDYTFNMSEDRNDFIYYLISLRENIKNSPQLKIY